MRIVFYLLLLVTACQPQKQTDEQIIRYWQGREVALPALSAKILGRDTVCPDISGKSYKILTCIDTAGCVSCKLKLLEWQKYIDEINTLSNNVAFVFIVYSKDYQWFEKQQAANRFYYPVFYDTVGQFNRINRLPEEFLFQTFLLDRHNRVLVVGNPVLISSVRKLYGKIITEKL